MMGVLDGEKAVPKSEQAKNQPGINNANSTVGDGGVKDPMDEHKYAQGTGGVKGNYKPQELIEAEEVVSLYNNIFKRVAEETGIKDSNNIYGLILLIGNHPDYGYIYKKEETGGIWTEAFNELKTIEEMTGYNYNQALTNLGREQKSFEEYKGIEETKAIIASRNVKQKIPIVSALEVIANGEVIERCAYANPISEEILDVINNNEGFLNEEYPDHSSSVALLTLKQ